MAPDPPAPPAPDPPVPPPTPPPPPPDPPAPDPPAPDDAELEAIRSDPAAAARRIEALKAEAAENRRKLRAAEQERDELQHAGLGDQERAVADAEKRGRAAADAEHARRTLEAEIRAAAAGKLADPTDAVRYLDVDALLELDERDRELDKAITKLLEDKAYLAANGDPPTPARGLQRSSQGARSTPGTTSGDDGSDWLRRAAGRGGK